MTSTRGIAGSSVPEQEGAFLCDHDSDVDYFVRMNNTGGPVDIWSVDGVDDVELLDNGSGYFYCNCSGHLRVVSTTCTADARTVGNSTPRSRS
jgi:hypothetical protein